MVTSSADCSQQLLQSWELLCLCDKLLVERLGLLDASVLLHRKGSKLLEEGAHPGCGLSSIRVDLLPLRSWLGAIPICLLLQHGAGVAGQSADRAATRLRSCAHTVSDGVPVVRHGMLLEPASQDPASQMAGSGLFWVHSAGSRLSTQCRKLATEGPSLDVLLHEAVRQLQQNLLE